MFIIPTHKKYEELSYFLATFDFFFSFLLFSFLISEWSVLILAISAASLRSFPNFSAASGEEGVGGEEEELRIWERNSEGEGRRKGRRVNEEEKEEDKWRIR